MNMPEQLAYYTSLRARDKRTRVNLPAGAVIANLDGKYEFTKIGAGRLRNRLNKMFPNANYQTYCSPDNQWRYVVACVEGSGK